MVLPFSSRDLKTILLIVAGQLLLTAWALSLVVSPDGISLMWLPDGYLLGVLLLLPRRLWLPLLLASALAVFTFESLTTDRPASMILLFMMANIIESWGAAWLYSSFASNHRKLEEFRDLVLFVLVCVVILPVISASIGAWGVVSHGYSESFWSVYRIWLMSAGLGILFVAPLILYVAHWFKQLNRELLKNQAPLYIVVLISAMIVTVPAFVFEGPHNLLMLSLFITIPLLIWSSLYYGLWGALLFSSLLVITTVQLSALGIGPFSATSQTSADAVLKLQGYLASVIVASMFTGLSTEKLRSIRERLELILNTLPYGIQENTNDGKVTYSNPAHHEILGYPEGDLIGKRIWDNEISEEASNRLKGYLDYLVKERPEPEPYITKNIRKDGSSLWMKVVWDYQLNEAQEVQGFISVISDISDSVAKEQRLQQAAEVFKSTGEGVIITDRDTNIIDVNQAFCEITGYAEDEIIGKQPNYFSSGKHDRWFYEDLWETIKSKGHWRGEIWDRRKNGELFPQLMTISEMTDDQGEVSGYVAVSRDITAFKDVEQRLEFLANHDPLTELPNRVLLIERLQQSILHAERNNTLLAVLLIDIDRLKTVNDSLGHAVGDRILKELSGRLLESVRADDTVARISGDEYVVILQDVGSVEHTINAVSKIMSVFMPVFKYGQHEIGVTGSIGISMYPSDGKDFATLLRNADVAMYRAKEDGRNTYQFYKEEMTAIAFERLFLENAIRKAIQNEEFFIVYQPQIDMPSRRIIGIEALIRWNHPEQGVVSPGKFIPVAEQTGQIREIGSWVLRQACQQAAQWLEQGLSFGRISVNVAGPQIQQAHFEQHVRQILQQTGLAAEYLELEVTESFVMQGIRHGVGYLHALRQLGVRISIDDFGTGYSSLSYLKSLPVDKIKIDQSFIHDIPLDPNDMAITQAIIALSEALELEVLAEGVETREQVEFLTRHGCEQAQGFLFSQPVDQHQITMLLSQQ
ncbi:bifunctional diguanylate cyclase/phosphodiesterase [Candidatus Thiodiazotropha endoloripes]|uniref:cyclic-guanylate-specific phosphodiesterase n=1 Tax=Candidatus Thiodiazotropha endoloripes TaxID=1818881 RepID=A0A1E2UH07_9GAMM|nr:EAL domain-containing protein [Candidatus Thiodiazotropha endoloripes]ODB91889.1 hypothetical protein A3196_19945 [Candidatus Thiodiazotropha endoloripes]